MDEFVLINEQATSVRQAYDRIQRVKLQLADLEIDYHNSKSELLRSIHESSMVYHHILKDIAQMAGITETGGTWDFDIHNLVYKRKK